MDYNPYHEKTVYEIKQKAKREQERRNAKEARRRLLERQQHMWRQARGYYD